MSEKRYTKDLTEKIGKMLLERNDLPQIKLANSLGVSARTLRNWKKKALDGRSPPIGRPTYTSLEKKRALIMVARELRRQGYPGSPAIFDGLDGKVPRRLVVLFVKKIKARRSLLHRERLAAQRVSISVLKKNVIWSQDGTHLGRLEKKAIEGQIIKDRSTLSTLSIDVGYAATEENILSQLTRMKETRGLPLVWMTDNGSAYIGKKLEEYLKNERVIHLRSSPRVPQHNAASERSMFELKTAAQLGKGIQLSNQLEAFEKLSKAARLIDTYRPRQSKDHKTAKELELEMDEFHVKIDREKFYLKAVNELKAIDALNDKKRAPTKKREAMFKLLCECQLITINRGVRENVWSKAEVLL